jgi:transposase-like protein
MTNTNSPESFREKRIHTPEFKLQVVLESFQKNTTIEEICRRYDLAQSVVHKWRKTFRQSAASIFLNPKEKKRKHPPGQSPDELKRIIGSVTVENEILKKALGRLD